MGGIAMCQACNINAQEKKDRRRYPWKTLPSSALTRQSTCFGCTAPPREMEATPHSGQCGHGRLPYVELKLEDIEKLFGRR